MSHTIKKYLNNRYISLITLMVTLLLLVVVLVFSNPVSKPLWFQGIATLGSIITVAIFIIQQNLAQEHIKQQALIQKAHKIKAIFEITHQHYTNFHLSLDKNDQNLLANSFALLEGYIDTLNSIAYMSYPTAHCIWAADQYIKSLQCMMLTIDAAAKIGSIPNESLLSKANNLKTRINQLKSQGKEQQFGMQSKGFIEANEVYNIVVLELSALDKSRSETTIKELDSHQ